MPSKLPRRRDAGDLVPTNQPVVVPMDPRTALILAGAHGAVQAGGQVGAAAAQAGGQIASAAVTVTATGRVLEASIDSFGQCFCAFMGYMREREITTRVVAQEREITARVVAQEEAATEQVRLWFGTQPAARLSRGSRDAGGLRGPLRPWAIGSVLQMTGLIVPDENDCQRDRARSARILAFISDGRLLSVLPINLMPRRPQRAAVLP
jgi:hypothetical protein